MNYIRIVFEIFKRVCRWLSISVQQLLPFTVGFALGYLMYFIIFYQAYYEGVVNPVKSKFISSLPSTNNILAGNSDATRNWGQIRVLCIVMTIPDRHKRRAIPIRKTWGERCTGIYFMTYNHDKQLGNTVILDSVDHSFNTWQKTKETWKYVLQNHINDYDWFLKVDDDVFVVMENLRYMLRNEDTTQPVYFGHLLKNDEFKYMSGYPGYVMSREAVRRFVNASFEHNMLGPCSRISFNTEDILLGKCLDYAQVKPMDTRDSQGRLRFLPLPLQYHFAVTRYRRKKVREMSSVSDRAFPLGVRCCSDIAIAFHEMDGKKIFSMEYLIYHLEAHGIRTKAGVGSINVTHAFAEDFKSTIISDKYL